MFASTGSSGYPYLAMWVEHTLPGMSTMPQSDEFSPGATPSGPTPAPNDSKQHVEASHVYGIAAMQQPAHDV